MIVQSLLWSIVIWAVALTALASIWVWALRNNPSRKRVYVNNSLVRIICKSELSVLLLLAGMIDGLLWLYVLFSEINEFFTSQ